jgi:hypothetical protein
MKIHQKRNTAALWLIMGMANSAAFSQWSNKLESTGPVGIGTANPETGILLHTYFSGAKRISKWKTPAPEIISIFALPRMTACF